MIYTVTFNPSIDYIVRMDSEINIGKTNRSVSEDFFVGGKGNNVSMVLKELGEESVSMGFTAGFTGRAIIEGLHKKGIQTDYVELPQGDSRVNIKLKCTGEETEINANGPDISRESMEELFSKIDKITANDYLVLAGSIPKSLPDTVYEDILDRISKRGVLSVVDASGKLLKNVLKYRPFLIKPNKQELEELFDVKIVTDGGIDECAAKLKSMGARNVIVSLGAQGARLYTDNNDIFVYPALEGKVKNTVGAGDSMVAGFLAGYLKYGDYDIAMRLANASAAATAFSEDLAKKDMIFELFN